MTRTYDRVEAPAHNNTHPEHLTRIASAAYAPGTNSHDASSHKNSAETMTKYQHSGSDTAAGVLGLPSDQHKGNTDQQKQNTDAVLKAEQNIESSLKKNGLDFKGTFDELEKLRQSNPKDFGSNLDSINNQLHKQGSLPKNMHLVQDDRIGPNGEAQHGYSVVAEDKQNPKGNRTEISTSHAAPEQSERSRDIYSHMKYGHGHYNGWHQSVDGGGGAGGKFKHDAVGGNVPQGARKELIDKALELAGLPVTASNEAAVNKIVTRESGWNPNITNNWDSNARAGHPSTGLMQTIPSTFKQFAAQGLNNNIHDPLSNLVAGIRYAESRYGNGKHGSQSGVEFVASRPGGY